MTDTSRLTAALADRYRIERELGAGGMATVYLAHDLRHDRHVALKVLRPELAAVIGADRFLKEIKVTANLQHPHILGLIDSGEADALLYYVMPYVEGESLRERLAREHQLPVDDAVRITREVASALDYAHRHHVIHRDIKPENILLHDGQALVADFGIALAVSAAGGTRMTETGMSLGTPHYMSPEQAMGEREITARSDVYALGVVLYEMLVGEPPFTGPTAQAIVAKVVTESPRPLLPQRHTIPAHVDAAALRALEKLPADRFESAKAFADALANPSFAPPTKAVAPVRGKRDWRPWAGAAVLLLGGVGLGRLLPGSRAATPVVARFSVSVDALHSLTGTPQNTLALSPDGGTVVYAARGGSTFQLYERRLDQLDDFHLIPGTEGGGYPTFSPDGTRLAYITNGRIQIVRVPFTGAPPVALGAGVQAQSAVDWLSDTSLVGTANDGALQRMGLDGSMTTIARPDSTVGERNIFVQDALPGGQAVLVVASTGSNVAGRLVALDTRNGRRVTVLDLDVNRAWYANGYLVYGVQNGALQAVAFDPRRLRVTGSAVTLAERVRQAIGAGAQAAVSASGTLVYQPEQPFSLMMVDRTGRQQVVAEGHRFHSPRFSPDGRYLAFDFIQDGDRDVWTYDLRQGTLSRISFEKDGHDPVWSRDGRWIYYDHAAGTWRRRADGGGTADSIFTGKQAQALEVTPHGPIIGAAIGSNGQFDLVTLSADSPHTVQPLLATPYNEEAATLSPNGHWLAYASDETGRAQVYVRQYPDGGSKVAVSQGTGIEPRWSPDGRTLYYEGERDGIPMLIAASVVAGSDFTVTARAPLFDISRFEPASPHANWDVAPDGSRFVMVNQGVLTQMVFIMNWPEEVRRQTVSGRSGASR